MKRLAVLATALVFGALLADNHHAMADSHGNVDAYEGVLDPNQAVSPKSVSSGWWARTIPTTVDVNQRYGCTDLSGEPDAAPKTGAIVCPLGYDAGWHQGIDIGLAKGTTIYSQVAGTVVDFAVSSCLDVGCPLGDLAIKTTAGGRIIYLLHGNPATNFRQIGNVVHVGDAIYTTGANGAYSSGPHLHFEVHKSVVGGLIHSPGPGDDINPEPWLYSCRSVFDEFEQGASSTLRQVLYTTGTGWHAQNIDPGNGSGQSDGQYASAMCAGSGLQVFDQRLGGGLRHAWSNPNGTFSASDAEWMDQGHSTGAYTVAVVDSLGVAHIFDQGLGPTLRHTYWKASCSCWNAWETLDGTGSTGAYTVALTDKDGNIHVFNQSPGGSLEHLWTTPGGGGTWTAHSVDLAYSTGSYISAALASTGGMNLFNLKVGGGLEHVWWTNATDDATASPDPNLDTSGSSGYYTASCVSADGVFHLFNEPFGATGVEHLWYDTVHLTWQVQLLDSGPYGSSGAWNSCGLSTDGGLQEFSEAYTGGLRHMYYSGGIWQAEPMDTTSIGSYTAALSVSP